MLLSKCAVCSSRKPRFIKEQEAKGLLSSLDLKAPMNKIPIFCETLCSTNEMWFFHERCSSSKIPRKFIEVIRSMTFPLIADIGNFKGMLSF